MKFSTKLKLSASKSVTSASSKTLAVKVRKQLNMIFPFVIEFEQDVKSTGDTASELNVFSIIQTYLKSKSVDDYYRTGNIIKFKKGFFGMNTNVFAIIDKGEFELLESNGKYKLKYRFYFLWHFIIATAMSIAFGLISQQITFALLFSLFFLSVIFSFHWLDNKE